MGTYLTPTSQLYHISYTHDNPRDHFFLSQMEQREVPHILIISKVVATQAKYININMFLYIHL